MVKGQRIGRFLAMVAVAICLVAARPRVAAAGCAYLQGFRALHDQIPDVVGACVTNEFHNALGDGLQLTRGGLLV